MNRFNINNYPKSYASIRAGDFRLKEYEELSPEELDKIANELYSFCLSHADTAVPIKFFEGLEYLDSGWEWSVFKKDSETVVKVPAGIFPEVNEPIYLNNTKEAYEVIQQFYPDTFIAKTKFIRRDGLNTIEQEFIDVDKNHDFIFRYAVMDKALILQLKEFLVCSLKLAEKTQWLPDYWLSEKEGGFLIRNVLRDKNTGQIKINDFTLYLDPARIYPEGSKRFIHSQITRLKELLAWIETRM